MTWNLEKDLKKSSNPEHRVQIHAARERSKMLTDAASTEPEPSTQPQPEPLVSHPNPNPTLNVLNIIEKAWPYNASQSYKYGDVFYFRESSRLAVFMLVISHEGEELKLQRLLTAQIESEE